jgi:hypothetical protein
MRTSVTSPVLSLCQIGQLVLFGTHNRTLGSMAHQRDLPRFVAVPHVDADGARLDDLVATTMQY